MFILLDYSLSLFQMFSSELTRKERSYFLDKIKIDMHQVLIQVLFFVLLCIKCFWVLN